MGLMYEVYIFTGLPIITKMKNSVFAAVPWKSSFLVASSCLLAYFHFSTEKGGVWLKTPCKYEKRVRDDEEEVWGSGAWIQFCAYHIVGGMHTIYTQICAYPAAISFRTKWPSATVFMGCTQGMAWQIHPSFSPCLPDCTFKQTNTKSISSDNQGDKEDPRQRVPSLFVKTFH